MTDNELIAEFMGGKYDEMSHSWTGLPKKHGGYSTPVNWAWDSNDILYDTSWDWLMPVVEKINNTMHPTLNERIDVIIYRRTCHINDMQQIIIETTGKDMLECTYKAVVQFIKWHKQQN